ncbi:hypothetical protein R69746_07008 [Paraburkholderia aspalathi]|uniref:hypothetical protein n=1 Tax=Paraburkholderia aspalathi TaxID=1324617 RepID=UPI00190A9943|nr:hypothetical protein [Paraburkholderia aspalathi]MBK3843000.1 hypothetical protein [Paraburkholderia aspalathi]CAE6842988.1 hypothetical protein R69746_07008 [Paraburkholderia aspalathi]
MNANPHRSQTQIIARSGANLASRVIATVALCVTFLLLMPLYPAQVSDGLDSSWAYAVNEALARHLVFGRDLIFTFGPLASVYTHLYHPATDGVMLTFSAFFALGLCLAFGLIATPGRVWLIWFLPVVIAAITYPDAKFLVLPFLLLMLVARVGVDEEHPLYLRPNWPVQLGIGIVTVAVALLPLIKGSFSAVVGANCLFAFLIIATRNKRAAFLFAAFLFVVPCLAWIAVGQPILALPNFFLAQKPIISGYTEAMSLHGPTDAWVAFLTVSVIVFGTFYIRVVRRHGITAHLLALGLALTVFIAFKAGFVRHDAHAYIAADTLLLLGLCLAITMNSRLSALVVAITLCGWFYISNTVAPLSVHEIGQRIEQSAVFAGEGIKVRSSGSSILEASFRESETAIRTASPLPNVAGTVDLYPYDLATVFAHHLAWSGRPILQSYSAYTSGLLDLNARHLLTDRAPANVFFTVAPIDNRLPSLDDSSSWPILMSAYSVRGFDSRYIQLERKASFAPPITGPQSQVTGTLNEFVAVPANGPTMAAIQMDMTLVGRLGMTAFKLPTLAIELKLDDGRVITHRYIPNLGQNSFLLSPYVSSDDDFLKLVAGIPDVPHVQAFRIVVPHLALWKSHFQVTFAPLHIESQNQIRRLLLIQSVVPPPFLYNSSEQSFAKCYLDRANGHPMAGPSSSVAINGGTLSVQGWTIPSAGDGIGPDSTWLDVIDEDGIHHFFPASEQDRPDVRAAFKHPNMKNPGFRGVLDLSSIRTPRQLKIYSTSGNKAFSCNMNLPLLGSGITNN